MEQPEKTKRGGARSGAGRPAKTDAKQTKCLRLAADVLALVNAQPERQQAAYIETAVRFYEQNKPA